MAETRPEESTDADDYVVRRYDRGDAADVLGLFETVWGVDRSPDWLAWQYEATPYCDGPAMVVAERDGTVVAARPYIPFPARGGGVDETGVLLHNAMVHPDHRRRGLFTRTTERTVAAQADGGAAFLFNFARPTSAPGYQKMPFRPVGVGPFKDVRIQSPGRFVRDRLRAPVGPIAGRIADVATDGYLRGRASLGSSPTPAGVTVERRAGVAAATLAACYDLAPPERLHTRREERLYRWFAEDPHWDYETYVAGTDDGAVAAALVRTEHGGTDPSPRIVDAVPPGGARPLALRALLGAVVADHRAAPAISVTGPVVKERLFPRSLLASFGFVATDRPLVSRVTAGPDTMFVGTPGGEYDHAGVGDLTDPRNWAVRVRAGTDRLARQAGWSPENGATVTRGERVLRLARRVRSKELGPRLPGTG